MQKTPAKTRSPRKSKSARSPSLSLQQLAKLQGVGRPINLRRVETLWPPEHDPEQFLAWLTEQRRSRRHAAGANGSR